MAIGFLYFDRDSSNEEIVYVGDYLGRSLLNILYFARPFLRYRYPALFKPRSCESGEHGEKVKQIILGFLKLLIVKKAQVMK